MSFVAAPIQRKTLSQRTNQKIRAEKVIEFSKKAGLPESEVIEAGGYLEYNDITCVKAAYFNKWAFIQNDKNLHEEAPGVQANNRQEVDKQWFQSFYFPMPDAEYTNLQGQEPNIDYFTINYRFSEYKDKLLDEKWINDSFEALNPSFDLLFANRFLFGVNRATTLRDGTFNANYHYNGLKDLITKAKTDTAITSVDNINLFNATPCRNIDLTTATSDLDTFAQLNNLENKLSQVNSVFAFGNVSGGDVWVSNGTSDIVYVCWNSLITKAKAKNFQFYKQLEELYSTGKLIKLPEASLDVEKENRDTTHTGRATPIAITPTSLGLDADTLLLYDRQGWQAFEYAMNPDRSQTITPNNVSQTHTRNRLCNVVDFLPTASICLVKVPLIIDLTDTTVP